MAARLIFNVKTIREKRFDTIHLDNTYGKLMGDPESKFIAMFYGPSGSGKSVFTLKFANIYANTVGKVLYNSHEEKVNQTIQERIIKFNIHSPKLYFGNALKFDEMVHKIERNHYRLVIIDSVQYMALTYEQLKDLRHTFAKRKLALIMVSFGTGLGNPTSSFKDHLHASDVKGYFHNGKLTMISRYTHKPAITNLFNPNAADIGGLFANI
jgi:hypothetical protein